MELQLDYFCAMCNAKINEGEHFLDYDGKDCFIDSNERYIDKDGLFCDEECWNTRKEAQ